MGRIPEHIIEQVRAAHAIEEIVGRTVELKRRGASLWGLCPFHDEKTPSFHVEPNRQIYKCFGCGKGGNVFRFITDTRGLTFPEAVRLLAAEVGIEVPETRGGGKEDRDRLDRIRRALQFAHDTFRAGLQGEEGAEARAYLTKRGYDADWQEQFELGYTLPGWDHLIRAAERRGIGAEVLEAAGLVLPRKDGSGYYDRFRGRIMFPVRDLYGRVVTFGARALDPEDNPKYLNGPETEVFQKARLLYGIDRSQKGMRARGDALLMEGYTDVLMAHRHGFDYAVAGMGTALTPEQIRLVARFTRRATLVYDADTAGQAAAERAVPLLLDQGLEVRIVRLPEGRDVDEILEEEGAEAFKALIDQAQEFFRFLLDRLGERHDLDSPRGRAEALEALIPFLLKVGPFERDQLVRTLAHELGGRETEDLLRAHLDTKAGRQRSRAALRPSRSAPAPLAADPTQEPTAAGRPPAATPGARARADSDARYEASILAILLGHPHLREGIFRKIGVDDFTVPAFQRLYNAILDLEDEGADYTVHTLMNLTAEDAEAASALADLPPAADVEETVTKDIAFLERRRRSRRKRDDIRRLAEQFRQSSRSAPPAPATTPSPAEPAPVIDTPETADTQAVSRPPVSSPSPASASVPEPTPPPVELPPLDETASYDDADSEWITDSDEAPT